MRRSLSMGLVLIYRTEWRFILEAMGSSVLFRRVAGIQKFQSLVAVEIWYEIKSAYLIQTCYAYRHREQFAERWFFWCI